MRFSRAVFVPVIAAALALMPACGDDETPSGPGTNPTPSTLTATGGLNNSVSASWTMCPDDDFAEYNLYRSASPGISSDPPSSPVRTVSNASDTTFVDTGLEWSATYFYALQTKNQGSNVSWSNEVQVTVPDSGGGCFFLTCFEIQGQQSSSPYDGQQVDVTALVYTGGDELYGGYAVLCDAEGGPWAGLTIYGDSGAFLARGDSITISGTVQEYYGFTELAYLSNVAVVSTGHSLPGPIPLTTAAVCDEQYESVFVSVTGAVVVSSGQYSYEINDGSGSCYIGTRGSYTEPSVGDTIDVQGPLFYEFDEWRIQPRDNNDITNHSGGGGGDVYTCYEIQGQQSSSPYEGQNVSVTGIVAAGSNDYTATSYTYSALADAGGGPWSGLLLFGSECAGLQRGDSVTVTGTVVEYYGMTELSVTSYAVHSTGHPLPDPEPLSTAELATAADPEQWESVFVTVSDCEVTQTGLPYYTWALDDGTGECYAGTMGDFSYGPVAGDQISSMTGMLWFSWNNFKIEPRDDGDITVR